MDVNGPGSIQSAFPIKSAQPSADVQKSAPARPVAPRDEVEISEAGKMLDNLNRSGEVRAERLAQIKAAIDNDTYETPEKLEQALERLLHEIGFDEDKFR
jgi:negative regulator of flagellin synthesis FlgM